MPRTQSLLSLLEAGFSDEELRTLLAEALLALDKAGLDALCSRLGEDTATTLRTMLSRLDDHPGERPAVSLDRIGQEWEEAWSAWDGIIEASGDQHGDFVEQENHWEPPCLDLYAIANGLDEVAGRLLPFVQHASDLEEAADFDLLAKVDEDLGNIGAGLPEWFGDVELGDVVGPRLTELVLRWEWHRGSKGTTPFAILDRIRRAECDSEGWTLDREALRGFVSRLPEAAQQEILRGLVEHGRMAHWAGVLTDAHSTWFPVYRELAQRWHPPVYLALCRDGISSDWSLAVPVLEDILARRAFAEADGVAASALDALLYLTCAARNGGTRGTACSWISRASGTAPDRMSQSPDSWTCWPASQRGGGTRRGPKCWTARPSSCSTGIDGTGLRCISTRSRTGATPAWPIASSGSGRRRSPGAVLPRGAETSPSDGCR